MPRDWDLESYSADATLLGATLLMWSGSEVTHTILGNRALRMSVLNRWVYALAKVCAKQDREENGSRHLRYKHCLHYTYKALNFVYVNACLWFQLLNNCYLLSLFRWYVDILRFVSSILPKQEKKAFLSELMVLWQDCMFKSGEDD